jgi:predicted ATPase
VMLKGASGSGKTKLLLEVRRIACIKRAIFGSAKFDQYKRDIPFGAFIVILRSLVSVFSHFRSVINSKQMQARSERTLERWKRRVKDLITPDSANILIACLPELKTILRVCDEGETEDFDSQLTSSESLIRLKSVIGRMLQTFTVRNKVFAFMVLEIYSRPA